MTGTIARLERMIKSGAEINFQGLQTVVCKLVKTIEGIYNTLNILLIWQLRASRGGSLSVNFVTSSIPPLEPEFPFPSPVLDYTKYYIAVIITICFGWMVTV